MDATQRQQFAKIVATARDSRGWSQATLADEAHIAPNTVSAIEAGKPVRPGSVSAVMTALDLEPMAQVQARIGYSPDVELVRDVVGLWLQGLPEGDRAVAAARLVRAMNDGTKGHNVDTATAANPT